MERILIVLCEFDVKYKINFKTSSMQHLQTHLLY